MSRSIMLILAVILLQVYSYPKQFEQEQTGTAKVDTLEGTYEFISESEELTKPRKYNRTITSDDWAGQWQFCNGRFFNILKKRTIDPSDYRLRASTGSYRLDGDRILLFPEISPELYEQGSLRVKYHFDGDKLILVQVVGPSHHTEDEGTIITVLRRRK